MVQSRIQCARCNNAARQKNGKKEAPAQKKIMQATKIVQYDKSMVPSLTYLIFSWRLWPPSWSKMLTLSWYHMIDVVLFFCFFENRKTTPHHQKKQEKVFSDTTARKNLFCNCKKNLLCQFMYQNPTYVISYFENLANLNCSFHTTKTLLNSTIVSSQQ
jgi:hypothetical protein